MLQGYINVSDRVAEPSAHRTIWMNEASNYKILLEIEIPGATSFANRNYSQLQSSLWSCPLVIAILIIVPSLRLNQL